LNKCPQLGYKRYNNVLKTYAAIHKNRNILMDSTSGGAMTSIEELILKKSGVVYGTYLDNEDWKVKFKYVDKLSALNDFRGSKYVQSDLGDSYKLIKGQLQQGIDVLFVGVPCQIAGLYNFLGERECVNLYTIDILCHGMPAPGLFVEHVKYLENKFKRKLTGFAFRDKTKFPNKTALKYEFGKKQVCVLGRCEPYFNAFLSGASYRNACYECQFAKNERVGDITLGDYWGIKEAHPEFDNSLGVSLVLVNSQKGLNLIEKANLLLVESNLEDAMNGNGILKKPSEKADCRQWFYKDVNEIGYIKAVRKNIKMYPMFYNFILTHLPEKIVKILSTRY